MIINVEKIKLNMKKHYDMKTNEMHADMHKHIKRAKNTKHK